jgi:hypothetical protein
VLPDPYETSSYPQANVSANVFFGAVLIADNTNAAAVSWSSFRGTRRVSRATDAQIVRSGKIRIMSCEFKIDEVNAIVQVCVHGTLSFEEQWAARSEAAHILQERHLQRLMVDLRDLQLGSRVSTQEGVGSGASDREVGIPTSTRIAHVLQRNPARLDNVKFTTTVALNRGVVVREFDDVDAARRWLLESKT